MSRTPVPLDGTEVLVRQLVTARFGGIRSVAQMTFGHGSVTYRVESDDTTVIVRTNVDPTVFAGTEANIDTLRALGLPVPTVIVADLTCTSVPFAYIVTDTFPGRDLRFELPDMTRSQLTRLAEQIVDFERRAMTLPAGQRFGFMPIASTAGHERWIDEIGSGRPANAVGLAADVYALLDLVGPRLDAIEPICFLDDLTTKNVIVYGGQLRGIVDFDVVCYGDPMYWLALTQVAVLSDIGGSGQFYVDELVRLWQPTDFERANLALYCGLHAIEFLSWGDGDDEWRDRMTTATRGWIVAAA